MSRIIRTLALAEIATLLDWAAAEGWNPGLDDAMPFQAADPTGFLGAFIDGQMVAAISAIAYDAHFGFIGLYICHPDWRGQGHGRAVWDAAMTYLGDRTIGLDAVPAQQANYAAMGFVPHDQTIRMSGILPDRPSAPQALPPNHLQALRDFDRHGFPVPRDPFLRHWLAPPRTLTVRHEDGAVSGYGVSRPCHHGAKIGPLFALTMNTALDILKAQSGIIHIDVPIAQHDWLAALSALGFVESFGTRRMYRGKPPTLNMPTIFGISTLELG